MKNYENFLAKDLKDQFFGMNIKQKVRRKIWQINIDTFLNRILLELIDYFVLIYSNKDGNAQRIKTPRYYLPKGIIRNYNVIINWKNFYNQQVSSNINDMKKLGKIILLDVY